MCLFCSPITPLTFLALKHVWDEWNQLPLKDYLFLRHLKAQKRRECYSNPLILPQQKKALLNKTVSF